MLEQKDREQLESQLMMLRELLEDTDDVDGETKQAMRGVSDEINRLLQTDEPTQDDRERFLPQLQKNWHDALIDFETHHPRLGEAIEQITGLLARMGL